MKLEQIYSQLKGSVIEAIVTDKLSSQVSNIMCKPVTGFQSNVRIKHMQQYEVWTISWLTGEMFYFVCITFKIWDPQEGLVDLLRRR